RQSRPGATRTRWVFPFIDPCADGSGAVGCCSRQQRVRAPPSVRVILERGTAEPNARHPPGPPARRPIDKGTREHVPGPEHGATADGEYEPSAGETTNRGALEGDARFQLRHYVPLPRGQHYFPAEGDAGRDGEDAKISESLM